MVFLFKPTLRCNIECGHCYVGSRRGEHGIMSASEAVYLISRLPKGSDIVFHGGEPTVLGPEYFLTVSASLFDKYRFAMQSNLLLVDWRWIELIKERLGGRISTSFDVGSPLRPVPERIWLDRVDFLKRSGITPYVVSILSRHNEKRGEKIFRFFDSLNLSFRVNPVLNLGEARKDLKGLRHRPGGYASAVKRVFDLWFMNPYTEIIVDPCAEILSFFIMGTSSKKCPFTDKCASYIFCIEPDGEVLPCAGFDDLGDFRYGNLREQPFSEILGSPRHLEAEKRGLQLPRECTGCRYFGFCKGGCRLEAYSYYGDVYHKTSLCDDYRKIFAHIESRLESEKGDYEDWLSSLYAGNGMPVRE